MAGAVRNVAKSLVRILMVAVATMLAGWLVSAICVVVGIWILASDKGAGFHGAGAGPLGAIVAIVVLFRVQPWAMSSIVAGLAGFVVSVVFAQKFVVQSAMYSLWSAGEAKFLVPLVSRCVAALDRISPQWMTGVVKWTALKANLLVALRHDPETGSFQKWIVRRILGKLSLEGELPADREGLTRMLVERIRGFMSGLIEPSLMLPGIVMLGQLALAVVAVLVSRS